MNAVSEIRLSLRNVSGELSVVTTADRLEIGFSTALGTTLSVDAPVVEIAPAETVAAEPIIAAEPETSEQVDKDRTVGLVEASGIEAGWQGAAPEDSPCEPGSPEAVLWERGRARGEAERSRRAAMVAKPAEEEAVAEAAPVVEEVVEATAKPIEEPVATIEPAVEPEPAAPVAEPQATDTPENPLDIPAFLRRSTSAEDAPVAAEPVTTTEPAPVAEPETTSGEATASEPTDPEWVAYDHAGGVLGRYKKCGLPLKKAIVSAFEKCQSEDEVHAVAGGNAKAVAGMAGEMLADVERAREAALARVKVTKSVTDAPAAVDEAESVEDAAVEDAPVDVVEEDVPLPLGEPGPEAVKPSLSTEPPAPVGEPAAELTAAKSLEVARVSMVDGDTDWAATFAALKKSLADLGSIADLDAWLVANGELFADLKKNVPTWFAALNDEFLRKRGALVSPGLPA